MLLLQHLFSNGIPICWFTVSTYQDVWVEKPFSNEISEKKINFQILWNDKPIFVNVFKLFCLLRRNFESTQKSLKNLENYFSIKTLNLCTFCRCTKITNLYFYLAIPFAHFGIDFNNQNMRKDRYKNVDMFKMFCLSWRTFQPSQ